ncbi:Magnesium-protoporphyrin O-methyltransferase [Dermatophilus congolensis]|uniref:Magnesium-protoporphyrin O-methyltransferase n=1 Tax=Dermatophilus congolensis TaxID=1863 RepID=A0AA46BQ96_9MICO|nr:class I SAM-dependent methyltransferase [Dermatophilus congolensis]STD15422.1 Magnesium-protoporphyrin O-methyltransferase [Dermatophilus congolensis]
MTAPANDYEPSAWDNIIAQNPNHSIWYRDRWRTMSANGEDIFGEARLIDAMATRGCRILDAGCGSGRVGGYLAQHGHTIVGVDGDPVLIEAARQDYPQATWITENLAALDLPAHEITDPFDLIVCAGNVMTFLAPSTRQRVLTRLAAHLTPAGRAVIGFGAGRGYEFDEFFQDAAQAGLTPSLNLASWDLQPYENGNFLVSVLRRY